MMRPTYKCESSVSGEAYREKYVNSTQDAIAQKQASGTVYFVTDDPRQMTYDP